MHSRELGEKQKGLEKVFLLLGNSLILVEGKRDEKALREAGIGGAVVQAVGKPHGVAERALEKAGGRKIVLLFDFDEEGKRREKEFQEIFLSMGAVADVLQRKKLRGILGITFFEDLARKKQEFYEKTGDLNG